MTHLQVIPILGQMKDTSVHVSHLWSPGGCHIRPGLTSIMAQDDSNFGSILAPSIYSSPIQIMASPQAILILEC